MDKEQRIKQQGILAQQILDNPVFEEAIMFLRARNYELFNQTTLEQTDQRTELWRRDLMITQLQQYFEQVLIEGELTNDQDPFTNLI